jgi:hypothetical protein
MRPVDYIVLTMSLLSALPYLCRMDALKFGEHKTSVVLFHVMLFVGCLWAGYDAFLGQTEFDNIAALVAAFLWIVISRETWSSGPPDHMQRKKDGVTQRGFIW